MAAGWDWTQAVDPRDAMPLHAQLERSIRVAIASRRLKSGDQLPTVRQLAVALRINANTVAKVYTHLERTGALQTRRGVGTFVVDPAEPGRNEEARQAELRAVAMRALADASARGFSAADLRRELNAISKGATP
ncbi:MAG TPA: GntR family transcriptional regulator [Vicinamibacterales bacterium]